MNIEDKLTFDDRSLRVLGAQERAAYPLQQPSRHESATDAPFLQNFRKITAVFHICPSLYHIYIYFSYPLLFKFYILKKKNKYFKEKKVE